jgi:hypothetical protein
MLGIILIIVASAMGYYTMTKYSRVVNILLVNGTVYTLDSSNTVAQAVAIRGTRIVAVGSSEDLRSRFNPERIIDLHGLTVMPGLVDGHAHVLGEGSRLHNLDFTGTASSGEVVQAVEKRAHELQRGQWIYGRGWDQNDWDVKEFPTHEALDQAAPDNPAVLTRIDGHAVWVNKTAMELAGINASTKDPDGGKIYRDAGGNPTGILVDNAIDLVDRVIPPLTDEQVEERIRLALDECARLGLTEVHDMGVDLQTIGAYKKIIDKGECKVRIYAAVSGGGDAWDHYKTAGPEIGYGNGMLTVRAVKMYMDGALGSRGAALIDAYADDPGNRGLTRTSEEEMKKICAEARDKGFQVCTHAIGDRGNNITLGVYESILSSLPKGSPPPRWRIEHAQILQLSDIPRFAHLGIIPSMQPTHATSDMYWAESRLGPERMKGAYAWRSLISSGSTIVGGSDFPVEGVNPLWGMYAAITRADKTGSPAEGWYASQRMSPLEAARAFTLWAAIGAFEESEKGTVESGKWADLTILNRDIMKIPPMEILKTAVSMTIVGGKIVYAAPDMSPAQ